MEATCAWTRVPSTGTQNPSRSQGNWTDSLELRAKAALAQDVQKQRRSQSQRLLLRQQSRQWRREQLAATFRDCLHTKESLMKNGAIISDVVSHYDHLYQSSCYWSLSEPYREPTFLPLQRCISQAPESLTSSTSLLSKCLPQCSPQKRGTSRQRCRI